jgi:hypothetical protein
MRCLRTSRIGWAMSEVSLHELDARLPPRRWVRVMRGNFNAYWVPELIVGPTRDEAMRSSAIDIPFRPRRLAGVAGLELARLQRHGLVSLIRGARDNCLSRVSTGPSLAVLSLPTGWQLSPFRAHTAAVRAPGVGCRGCRS